MFGQVLGGIGGGFPWSGKADIETLPPSETPGKFGPQPLTAPTGLGPAVTAPKWSELPVEVRSEKLASKVRALAGELVETSWGKLKKELEVQKLVWQSVARVQGEAAQESVKDQAAIQSQLEAALGAWKSGSGDDTGRALLEKVEQALGKTSDLLGNSVRDAIRNVIKHESARGPRKALAEKLAVASSPAVMACTDKELEDLVIASHLGDSTLERRVRLLLRLTVPAELSLSGTSSRNRSSQVGAAVRSKHSQSAMLGSAAAGKKTSSMVGAPLLERNCASALPGSLGNATTGKKSMSELPSSPVMRASKAAERVRGLATGPWKRLQDEFDVQKLVWESQALTKGKDFQQDVLNLRTRFDSALCSLTGGVGDHVIVEQALREGHGLSGQVSGLLTKAMLEAANNVIKQAPCAASRSRLAEKLAAAESISPGSQMLTPAASRDLEALISACAIEDPKLLINVRRALRLSLTAEPGARLVPKKVSKESKGAAVRSASTGVIGKAKVKQEMMFQPDKRDPVELHELLQL